MNQPRISIILVSYQVRQLLLSCLESIRQTIGLGADVEVLVIDNASTDGSVDAVKAAFPEVILIANSFNAGFSGANNQGIVQAKGDYIFLLNPDTELLPGAVEKLLAYLEAHSACVLVAPQLLNSDGSLQLSAWKETRVLALLLETVYLHVFFPVSPYPIEQLRSVFEPSSLSGAALFFRKSLITQIGMLDTALFWMEDVDFCRRARTTGHLAYLPSAQVIHHSGQSQKRNYHIAISNQLLSKLKYFRKYHSRPVCWVGNVACFIFVCSRIIAFGVASPMGEIYRLKRKAYLYTFRKLMRYLFLNDQTVV